ncbi:MAG: N-acetylmuramoyl-L-alanine amidase [Eubacteriales bacterium]|nr:N-acetylmuramoyl-L-alanine amidase [Eubacteriales bacterium]
MIKKIGIIILAFILICFAGCTAPADSTGGQTSSVTEPETEEPAVESVPTESVEEQPADKTPIPTTQPDTDVAPAIPLDVTYRVGDEGSEIKFLQQMLADLGFDPGDLDGVFGDALKSAVSNFQLYAGLTADGIAGPKTTAGLYERWVDAQQAAQPADDQPLLGCVIGIDAGHQRNSNSDQEPVSPGGTDTKSKVSSGTYGRFSGVPEYVINLQVALKLKSALEALGAEVVMTRTAHDVDISNAERAEMMNESGVDCWLRIHANGSNDQSVHGMFILVPAEGSLDTDDDIVARKSVALAEALLDSTLEATGAKDLGITPRSDQTGFCWSQVPVCNIEMGHMTNEQEDYLLVSESYQEKIVQGLVQGFVAYFHSD